MTVRKICDANLVVYSRSVCANESIIRSSVANLTSCINPFVLTVCDGSPETSVFVFFREREHKQHTPPPQAKQKKKRQDQDEKDKRTLHRGVNRNEGIATPREETRKIAPIRRMAAVENSYAHQVQ